ISRAKKRNAKKNKSLDDSDLKQAFIKIISIQKISNYITNIINDFNDHAELSLIFRVQCNKATIKDIDADVRIMAKLIIDKIEEGNNYN
ncbi:7266_t:CDS:1, partial [Cetraspora pellucida]